MFSSLKCYVLLLTSHWSHITRGSGSEILLGTQKEEKQKYMRITLKTIINADLKITCYLPHRVVVRTKCDHICRELSTVPVTW